MDWQVLLGGTLIDGTGCDPVPNSAIVINGERIVYAGPNNGVEWPETAVVQRIDGKTVMPGIIDCHDHLAHPGLDVERRIESPLTLGVYETGVSLRQTLHAGITTVRDAGGLDYGAKLAVEQGIVEGPRLIVSLAILCPTGGLGDPCCPSGTTIPSLPGLPDGIRNGPDDCRLGVREMVAAGADAIKIATTGGVGSRWHGALDRQFTDQEVYALVDEAHAWGKRVLSHSHGGSGARAAIKAGVDSLDHGSYLHQDEDLLREMAERHIFLVPTLSVVIDHLARGSAVHRGKAQGILEHCHRSIQRACELGVPMAMGTDAGAYGHAKNARELRFLVDAGLSPMQAIEMSTARAAECIGLERDLGTLSAAKYADLLVLDGDPLQDVNILTHQDKLLMVMKQGHAYVNKLVGEMSAVS